MDDSDIVLSPEAYDDLDSIYDYIAQDNPMAAALLISRFNRAFRLLAAFPRSGTPLKVSQPEGRLMFPVRGYRIIHL
jgi:plasmid stabilization system protein ParE